MELLYFSQYQNQQFDHLNVDACEGSADKAAKGTKDSANFYM